MAEFDIYAFADYSGADKDAQQRKAIAWCVGSAGAADERLSAAGLTRSELLAAARQLLAGATAAGQRVVFGFDHNYSFPDGFAKAVWGEPPGNWRRLLEQCADSLAAEADPASGGLRPRLWAARMNSLIAKRLGTGTGPFWGPHFSPSRRVFPFEQEAERLPERRLTETCRPGMKSVYQLGGTGSVGLQSLYGMYHLRQLIRFCRSRDIPLHAWPFDGWAPPPQAHVLVEVYPTLYQAGAAPRSDAGDAIACVRWAREQDRLGRLASWLAEPPGLTPSELERIAVEGWVLGVSLITGSSP